MLSSTAARVTPIILMLLAAGVSRGANYQSSVPDDLARLASDKNYVDVSNIPNVHVSLRYASDNNFMGKNMYGDFHSCLLQTFELLTECRSLEHFQTERCEFPELSKASIID